MLKSKRTSLRRDSKEIQLACGGWDWKNVVSPRQEGERQQTAHTGLWEGNSRDLSCSVELPQPLSYLSIFPIYSLINRSLRVCHLGNSPSVTQCRWYLEDSVSLHLTPASCKQGFSCYFQKLIAAKYSKKILSCGSLSILSLAIIQIKERQWSVEKKINKKIDAYIFPNQFTHSWKKTQSSNVSLYVRMQNNA